MEILRIQSSPTPTLLLNMYMKVLGEVVWIGGGGWCHQYVDGTHLSFPSNSTEDVQSFRDFK